jgi:hypothetical protein
VRLAPTNVKEMASALPASSVRRRLARARYAGTRYFRQGALRRMSGPRPATSATSCTIYSRMHNLQAERFYKSIGIQVPLVNDSGKAGDGKD